MYSTEDFPQADRIFAVGRLVEAAHRGARSDLELEQAIGLDSNGRQGRYYRRAAVVLGLLERTVEGYVPSPLGERYASSTEPGVQTSILRHAVKSSPVFASLLDYVGTQEPSISELRARMYAIYPGEVGTAQRRWSSILRYLVDLGIVAQLGDRIVLVAKALIDEQTSDSADDDSSAPAESERLTNLSPRYAGFCADPVLRKAVEMQAVEQATAYYSGLGYEVTDVGATESYDLHVVSESGEVRHAEVKGSQGPISRIILTKNEVLHACTFERTDLVTVGDISWERDGDVIFTMDGTMDVYRDWRPSERGLEPLSYLYTLD